MADTLTNLAKAVCAVMGEVGYVTATGKNTRQGYKYTSDVDLLTAIQPLLVKHGLAILPTSYTAERTQFQTGSGAQMWRTDVNVAYVLLHTSGESIVLNMGGSGSDSLDKDPYKALTGAYKYLLRQTFAVPTGEDAERDHAKTSGNPAPQAATNPQPNSKPHYSDRIEECDNQPQVMAVLQDLRADIDAKRVNAQHAHNAAGMAARRWLELATSAEQVDSVKPIMAQAWGISKPLAQTTHGERLIDYAKRMKAHLADTSEPEPEWTDE